MGKVKFANEVSSYLGFLKARAKRQGNRLEIEEIFNRLSKSQQITNRLSSWEFIKQEMHWIKAKKPFFNIYPSVIASLANTSMKIAPCQIPKSIVNELGIVCVKLPLNTVGGLEGVSHFFIHFGDLIEVTPSENPSVCVVYSSSSDWGSDCCFFHHTTEMEETFDSEDHDVQEKQLLSSPALNMVPLTDRERTQRSLIVKLAIGVLMLASDPEFITPVRLSSDFGKELSPEEITKRAKKRGVFGFEIGKDFEQREVSPHLRRPHFAIRWTGKGATVPKLVPVKGSIVKRSELTSVPTGFEDASDR